MTLEDENIRALLRETKEQFNYSSNLFDSLESKANTLIVSITLILVISLNPYFLEMMSQTSLYLKLLYYIGIVLVSYSFIIVLTLRKAKFELVNLKDMKSDFRKNPKRDFRKRLFSNYISIIDKNLDLYKKKKFKLVSALKIMGMGMLFLSIGIIYIIIKTLFHI